LGLFRLIVRALSSGASPQPRRRARPLQKNPPPRPWGEPRAKSRPTVAKKAPPGAQRLASAAVVRVQTVVASRERAISGRCWVIDGDTIVIGKINIRLAGIDAPELDHPYGQASKWALVALTRGRRVMAEVTGDLSYDRVVARCLLDDGRDLAAELVKQGLAIDWARYSGGTYRDLEPEGIRKRLWRADRRQWGEAFYRGS